MTNERLSLRRKGDQMVVDSVDFPLFIRSESPNGPTEPIDSFIEIRTMGGYYFDHPDMQTPLRSRTLLFMLGNAELRTRDNSGVMEGDITIKHSFARDDEGDRARIASFGLTGFNFGMASSGTYQFSGWLSDMRFYSDADSDYFTQHGGDLAGDYENIEFPYQPPHVAVKQLRLPILVEVVCTARGDFEPGEYWDDVKKTYDNKRAAK